MEFFRGEKAKSDKRLAQEKQCYDTINKKYIKSEMLVADLRREASIASTTISSLKEDNEKLEEQTQVKDNLLKQERNIFSKEIKALEVRFFSM